METSLLNLIMIITANYVNSFSGSTVGALSDVYKCFVWAYISSCVCWQTEIFI